MRDTGSSDDGLGSYVVLENLDLAHLAPAIEAAVTFADDRQARRVVPAVLQPLQTFQKDRSNLSIRHRADDSAHIRSST
jgi:hypothetical protein